MGKVAIVGLMAAIIVLLLPAPAGATVYLVDRAIGDGSVKGRITTTDTTGVLVTGNIVDWTLTLVDKSGTSVDIGGPKSGKDNASVEVSGTALTASTKALRFDFGTDAGFLLFRSPKGGAADGLWCVYVATCTQPALTGGEAVWATHGGVNEANAAREGLVILAIAKVPEPATLALLGGAAGGLLLAYRRRKR